jgi:hypothetical protein
MVEFSTALPAGAELRGDGRKAAATPAAAKAFPGSLDSVAGIVKLGVFIATEGDFREHPKIADGALGSHTPAFNPTIWGRVTRSVASRK